MRCLDCEIETIKRDINLTSNDQKISKLKEKMKEYIDNGASLGWLIDPQSKKVYTYRPNMEVEIFVWDLRP